MSLLPKKFSFQQTSINGIKTIEDVKRVLGSFTNEFDRWYSKLYDSLEAGGMSTSNWDIKEATSLDVTNGDAKVAGNLIARHKTNGTKREFEQ